MFASTRLLGSTDQGTSFADIITNNVAAVSENQVSGFEGFLHDPKLLKETVEYIGKMAVPQRFIEAVTARRVATATINATWRCPLNLQTPLTCPIPWVLVESSQRTSSGNRTEYQLMRTVDFIGRNYIRIELPEVDTTEITTKSGKMTNPNEMYLGAWHRDLVPRIISEVEFYPRSSQHRLFTYTGYDIAAHNIIFGNANKEMNDLMAGEDRFELAYDPYRVDGTALGIASFKGIDTFKEYESPNITGANTTAGYTNKLTQATQCYTSSNGQMAGFNYKQVQNSSSEPLEGQDGFIDSFQLDTTMDDEEFKTFYRRNVWYEAPVAVPYDCRHSIHSRRFYHRKTIIIIPLDVLPFGYSIEASLPASALAGDCGYISIQKYQDWFDRAFYLTKLSNVPSLHPIVQHRHYQEGDAVVQSVGYQHDGKTDLTEGWGIVGSKFMRNVDGESISYSGDPRNGWVNPRSVGKFNDIEFMQSEVGLVQPSSTGSAEELNVGYETTQQPTSTMVDNVIGMPDGLEGVVPTIVKPQIAKDDQDYKNKPTTLYKGYNYKKQTGPFNYSKVPTSASATAAQRLDYNSSDTSNTFLLKPSDVDRAWFTTISQAINIKLIQTGYVVLQCIKQLLTKLPNIYITTEWSDEDFSINQKEFKINNDLYIMAILLWFLPKDSNGIESMRVYPHHKKDTEYPLCAGVFLQNEQSQGKTLMSWDMMNLIEPAHMGLSPLLSNMGIISFTPLMKPNTLPYGIYDQNLSGYLIGKFEKGDDSNVYDGCVNLREGIVKSISIGINGVANVNLSLFRLVF